MLTTRNDAKTYIAERIGSESTDALVEAFLSVIPWREVEGLTDERWAEVLDEAGAANSIRVLLESANGPKVIYPADADEAAVLSALPAGWTVADDDWSLEVTLRTGERSVPLCRTDAKASQ